MVISEVLAKVNVISGFLVFFFCLISKLLGALNVLSELNTSFQTSSGWLSSALCFIHDMHPEKRMGFWHRYKCTMGCSKNIGFRKRSLPL